MERIRRCDKPGCEKTENLKCCKGCHGNSKGYYSPKYCSRECQVSHWPLHKEDCRKCIMGRDEKTLRKPETCLACKEEPFLSAMDKKRESQCDKEWEREHLRRTILFKSFCFDSHKVVPSIPKLPPYNPEDDHLIQSQLHFFTVHAMDYLLKMKRDGSF